ncbi:MAG: 50S ribosomal protein L10 [Armatimonadota bacterium]|nr:50S ribosomal protein L10 [Armatimonadota bacterium]MDR5704184.1 50S ribosomal protein L10 [Armatimonadota bacterium]
MAKPEKVMQVQELQEKLRGASAVILTDFRGLNVSEINTVRRRLREVQTEYRVVKNTLLRIAASGLGIQGLDAFLEGPTAVAFVRGDVVDVAKIFQDFIRQVRKLEVKGGLLDGRILSPADIQTLAQLPPKHELRARVVGGLQSPLTRLVSVLSGPVRSLVYVLDAIRRQREAASFTGSAES